MLLRPRPLLWTAIENTRMIRFAYHGKDRLVEPHDHGILNGYVQLLSWQVAGSGSRTIHPGQTSQRSPACWFRVARSLVQQWTRRSLFSRLTRFLHDIFSGETARGPRQSTAIELPHSRFARPHAAPARLLSTPCETADDIRIYQSYLLDRQGAPENAVNAILPGWI